MMLLQPERRLVTLQYLANLPPKDARFRWPSFQALFGIQDHLLDDLLLRKQESFDEDFSYKRVFLREVITRLEKGLEEFGDSEAEINGEVLEMYASLMASNASTAQAPSSRKVLYYYPSSTQIQSVKESEELFPGWENITILENASTISRGTTGLKTWEASLRLAAHLLAQSASLLSQPGLRILELGSGSGLLGSLIAKEASQARILLTDLEGIVLDRLQQTIEENSLAYNSSNVNIAALDWLDVQDESSVSSKLLHSFQPNLIVAADIVYDPDLLEPLCNVLRCALTACNKSKVKSDQQQQQQQPFALISSTVRNETTYSLFHQAICKSKLYAKEEKLARPSIDLGTARLVKQGSSTDGHIALFPTFHDPAVDGPIKLIKVTLLPE